MVRSPRLTGRSPPCTRLITVSDEQTGEARRLRNLIEVDADIIPGDSGGALIDESGDVVGMNVAASSGSPSITGYVIPIRRVLRVADQVLAGDASGTVEIGYDAFLGVSMGSGLTLVGVVDGSAAADAGLGAGDTVTSLGGTDRLDPDPAAPRRRRSRAGRHRDRHLDRPLRYLPLRLRHPRPRPRLLTPNRDYPEGAGDQAGQPP